MIERIKEYFEKKRALQLVGSLSAWHESCSLVSETCGEALYDPAIATKDIGVVLDRVDKELFALRNHTAEATSSLKGSNRRLAKRVAEISNDVYSLRNETARFLIRCQGPAPTTALAASDTQDLEAYYNRALEDVGLKARQMQAEVSEQIRSLWSDLGMVMAQAQKYTHAP